MRIWEKRFVSASWFGVFYTLLPVLYMALPEILDGNQDPRYQFCFILLNFLWIVLPLSSVIIGACYGHTLLTSPHNWRTATIRGGRISLITIVLSIIIIKLVMWGLLELYPEYLAVCRDEYEYGRAMGGTTTVLFLILPFYVIGGGIVGGVLSFSQKLMSRSSKQK